MLDSLPIRGHAHSLQDEVYFRVNSAKFNVHIRNRVSDALVRVIVTALTDGEAHRDSRRRTV